MTDKKVREQLERFNDLLETMMQSSEDKQSALHGLRVLEISYASFPGLICGAMLGEMGADVVKIEPPQGDPAREATYNGVYIRDVGIPFVIENRNKRMLMADFNEDRYVEKIKELAKKADIIIDAMPPGYLDSRGIGYRQLAGINPGLIYAALSPYGHYTAKAKEYKNIPDTDLTAQAESGYPALTGDPDAREPYNYPLRAGIWAASYMGAAIAVAGILTALMYRRKTGEGQMVDMATYDAISAWQGFSHVWGFTNEMPRTRIGNFDWCLFPYGYYKAKDGYVTIAAASDADFRGLLKILGRWDLEDDWRFLFDRIADDPEKLRELEVEIKKEIAKYTRKELYEKTFAYGARAARDTLRSRGFPIVVETRSPREAASEKHWQVRKSFVQIDIEGFGVIRIAALPPRMSGSPSHTRWIKTGIGEDDEEIFGESDLKIL